MCFKHWRFDVCVVLVICCPLGLYCLQAQPEEATEAIKRFAALSKAAPRPLESDVFVEGDTFSETLDSDFYQTIIQNNLFAPLGTDLNPKQNRGVHLKLLATQVYPAKPVAATAWIQDTVTDEYRKVFLGDSIDGLMLTDVQPKQVTLQREGETVILSLETDMFLNTQRR